VWCGVVRGIIGGGVVECAVREREREMEREMERERERERDGEDKRNRQLIEFGEEWVEQEGRD
jgi:xanthine/CO dehydrogenase XdhC/CoxF family maturation factor